MKPNLSKIDISKIEARANIAARAARRSDYAECMAEDCLTLIAEVRNLQKLVPVVKAARRVVYNNDGDLYTAILELEETLITSRKKP